MSNNEILNKKHEFECDGVTYQVGLITDDIKNAYSLYLFARAKRLAAASKDIMTDAEYQARLSILDDDYLTGKYDFYAELAGKVMLTPTGQIKLLSMLFEVPDSVMTGIIVKKPMECASLFKVIYCESFGVTAKQLDEAIAKNDNLNVKKKQSEGDS